MPKILINEIDRTKPGLSEFKNYAVAIPGFRSVAYNINEEGGEREYLSVFDTNHIYKCSDVKSFVNNVGKVPAIEGNISDEVSEESYVAAHYGNQMAYELLRMGIPILYLDLGCIPDSYLSEDESPTEEDLKLVQGKYDEVLHNATFWEALKDKANYDFRFITHGFLKDPNINLANKAITDIASYVGEKGGRGDCIALVEINENIYDHTSSPSDLINKIATEVNKNLGDLASEGKYAAITVPSVCYSMTPDPAYRGNNKFPASFHYLACFANMIQKGTAEWYAAAGYQNGRSGFVVDKTSVDLGEAAINALEPRSKTEDGITRAVNVIANFRGDYYLWGNRTAYLLGEELVASHFLNIRHLCTTIKKQLYVNCRRFTFTPNSDSLWFNFKAAIEPTLDKMKADQGLRSYELIRVKSPKKATLSAIVRIVPIEAVEDFELEISLEDSAEGISINE